MTFGDLLKEYMGSMTLDEMVSLCAQRGLNYDRTYISKLRTGDRPPPDNEEAVQIMAEVCKCDPAPLVLLAKIERHPHETYPQLLRMAVAAGRSARSMAHTHFETLTKVEEWLQERRSAEWIAERLTQRRSSDMTTHHDDLEVYGQFTRTLRFLGLGYRDPVGDLEKKAKGEGLPLIRRSEAEVIQELAEVVELPAAVLAELVDSGRKIAGLLGNQK